jgi:hypothetical protein
MWVYNNSDSDFRYAWKLNNGDEVDYDFGYFPGSGGVRVSNGKSEVYVGGLTTSAWSFVVGQVNDSEGKIKGSINGGSFGSDTLVDNDGSDNSLYIGFQPGGGSPDYFDGRMCRAGFWKRALSIFEVQQLYNQGCGLKYSQLSSALKSSLSAYWDMDEAADSTRADSHSTHDLTDNNGVGVADAVCE